MTQDSNKKTESAIDDSKTGGYKKYLTEIKELPPEVLEERKAILAKPEKPAEEPSLFQEKGKEIGLDDEIKILKPSQGVGPVVSEADMSEDVEEEVSSKKLPLSAKDIILGVINLVSLILLFIILSKLPQKAGELNTLKYEKIASDTGISFEFSGIEEAKLKSNDLKKLFLDEPGIVNFVNQVESLKGEGRSIQKISFATQNVVKDRTGNSGIPVVIELTGGWQTIGQDLEKIDILPFLFRPARIEIKRETDEEKVGVVIFKYGIFLYVDDKLGKN